MGSCYATLRKNATFRYVSFVNIHVSTYVGVCPGAAAFVVIPHSCMRKSFGVRTRRLPQIAPVSRPTLTICCLSVVKSASQSYTVCALGMYFIVWPICTHVALQVARSMICRHERCPFPDFRANSLHVSVHCLVLVISPAGRRNVGIFG